MTRDSRDPAPGNAARPRRRWPWLLVAASIVLALPGSWLLAHRLASRDFPPAPWSASELPTIPAAAENGLDDIVATRGGWRVTTSKEELIPLVVPLERETPAERWAVIEAARSRVADWKGAGTDATLRASELVRFDGVLAAPRFADPCDGVGAECHMVAAIHLVRFAAIADLDAALQGDWSAALQRALKLLVAANDFVVSARTMLGNSAALVFAHIATDHVRVLLTGYAATAERRAAAGETPLPMRQTLDTIARALSAPLRTDIDARRAVIAECFWIRDTLMPLLEDPTNYPGAGGFLAPYLVDPRGTITASDKQFIALMQWVEAPDHATRPPPTLRTHASGLGWWLWNPAGKAILDLGGSDFAGVITRMDEFADALFVSRDALRSELTTLRE